VAVGRPIEVRPIEEAQAETVASLWFEAFPAKFGHLLGPSALAFLEDWLARDPGVFEGTWLAWIDAEAVGFLQATSQRCRARRADVMGRHGRALPLLRVARRHLGWRGVLGCLARLAWIDTRLPRSGEYHIEMMGVAEAWRGRGIGARLLSHAEGEARGGGFERITLGVVLDNEAARRLYERLGFATQGVVRPRLFPWAVGSSGYVAMAKTLD